MDVIQKLNKIRLERNMSVYRLAELSGINQSTLANTFSRGTVPSIQTLEIICETLGISLSEFFLKDNETIVVNKKDEQFYSNYKKLPINIQNEINNLINSIINSINTK